MAGALITLILAMIVGGATALLVNYIKEVRSRKDKMSFKESMDLTELPVVTFYTKDNKKLNFLLDTGSNTSYINEKELKHIEHEKLPYASKVIGLGEQMECQFIKVDFYYKDYKFECTLQSINLSDTFEQIKKESGVTIHGILGSKFFAQYKYVLDFNELIAYRK